MKINSKTQNNRSEWSRRKRFAKVQPLRSSPRAAESRRKSIWTGICGSLWGKKSENKQKVDFLKIQV